MHHITPPPARKLRQSARVALKKKWAPAVLVAVLSTYLGVYLSDSLPATAAVMLDPFYLFERFGSPLAPGFFSAIYHKAIDFFRAVIQHFDSFWAAIQPALLTAAITLLSFGATFLVIGSPIRLGLARFHLLLLDGDSPSIKVLFYAYRDQFFRALGLRVLRVCRILLWSCLLIVPGVIASYRYAMADYVLAENPDMSIGDALDESARMMQGNKWRLFCLQLSFIGYLILSLITFDLAALWVRPYMEQAKAQFYHRVSGRADIRRMVLDLSELSLGL